MPNIHQEIDIEAPVQNVYSALTRSDSFAELTGKPADISPNEGGAFVAFDAMISGRHIELVPNERIVQAWRVSTWEAGAFSIVKFDLKATDQGARIVFDHKGYPTDAHEHLERGWHQMYWEPLRQFLSSDRGS